MTEGDDSQKRFLPRIREELDKLPLTNIQKDELAATLLDHTGFLDTRGGKESAGLRTDSSFFKFSEKIKAVADHFAQDGLTADNYIRAAFAQPQLLYQLPDTVIHNITGAVQAFASQGLTTRAYLKAALNEPALFSLTPERVKYNITTVTDRFANDGLTPKQYLTTALRRPSLFTDSPEKIERNITGPVERFASQGLDTCDFISAALKQPSVLEQSPDKTIANIEGVVGRFAKDGLTTREYLRATIKQPSLISMLPESVASHIKDVVERYAADGLTTSDYLRAALKHPSLFATSPETASRHIDSVLSLADRGVFSPPESQRTRQPVPPPSNSTHALVLEFLLRNPRIISLADDNIALREIHQRLTDGRTDQQMLHRSRQSVERDLMGHLGHDDPTQPVRKDGFTAGMPNPTDEQATRFVLRALMHAGLIRGGSMER